MLTDGLAVFGIVAVLSRADAKKQTEGGVGKDLEPFATNILPSLKRSRADARTEWISKTPAQYKRVACSLIPMQVIAQWHHRYYEVQYGFQFERDGGKCSPHRDWPVVDSHIADTNL